MLEPLGSLLPRALQRYRLERPVTARQLLATAEARAKELAPQSQVWARRLGADGWILLEVDHAATAQQLTPHLKTLTGELHRQFTQLSFKGIHLRVKL